MMVDGLLGHDETLGDLRVTQPVGEEQEHLELAPGQAAWILARARPSLKPSGPAGPQPPRDDRRTGVRAGAASLSVVVWYSPVATVSSVFSDVISA